MIENPVLTVEILKEDVLLRYLASFKLKEIDDVAMQSTGLGSECEVYDVPEWVCHCQPGILCTLTNTTIAVANRVNGWEDISGNSTNLVDDQCLGNGWLR